MANIQFNNIKEIGLPIGAMPIGVDGLTEDLIAENGGIINAVQIDWNGAVLPAYSATGLSTTSEILNVLNTAYSVAKEANSKSVDLSNYYKKTEVYSKNEVGTQITNAINALDMTDTAVVGKYVSAVSETNGVISVTRASLPATPTLSTLGGITPAAVDTKITTAINALDVTDAAVSGQYVSQVTQADGKIKVTRASLPATPTLSTLGGITPAAVDTKITTAINALDKSDTAVAGKYVSAVSEANGVITVTRADLPTTPVASTSVNGLMSKDDKAKLDKIEFNCAKFTVQNSGNIIPAGWYRIAKIFDCPSTETSYPFGYDIIINMEGNSISQSSNISISSTAGGDNTLIIDNGTCNYGQDKQQVFTDVRIVQEKVYNSGTGSRAAYLDVYIHNNHTVKSTGLYYSIHWNGGSPQQKYNELTPIVYGANEFVSKGNVAPYSIDVINNKTGKGEKVYISQIKLERISTPNTSMTLNKTSLALQNGVQDKTLVITYTGNIVSPDAFSYNCSSASVVFKNSSEAGKVYAYITPKNTGSTTLSITCNNSIKADISLSVNQTTTTSSSSTTSSSTTSSSTTSTSSTSTTTHPAPKTVKCSKCGYTYVDYGNTVCPSCLGNGTTTTSSSSTTSSSTTSSTTSSSTPVPTKNYWYAGQNQPTSSSSNPTPDDTNFTNNKWHTLADGATQIKQGVQGGTSGSNWYVAFPNSFGFEIKASDLVTTDTTATKLSNITINSKTYNVYKLNSTASRTTIYAAKK